ncbi:MAG TPA: hypothetical protein VFG55_05420 [Rhodanobacteraceae bacterium]|nr:hypothetical protein [Rhodanobacteraceae bacterium]
MKHSIRHGLVSALVIAVSLTIAPAGQTRGRGARPATASPGQIAGGGGGLSEDERVNLGFALAPVPLDMEGRDPRLVGLGSYMINAVGSCNDCHTEPPYLAGGDPFMGQPEQINTVNYLAGGAEFGPFISRNITPSLENGLPAGRTFDEFTQIMLTGVDLECAPGDPPPCPLLQVMPWPAYQDMTEHELRAIYEYLSAIPHAEPGGDRQ